MYIYIHIYIYTLIPMIFRYPLPPDSHDIPSPRNKKATGRQVAGTGGALHAVHGSIQTGERQECHHRQSQADANCADAGDEENGVLDGA